MSNDVIRNVKIKDAEEIVNIYNYYIINTPITFEEKALTKDEMKERIIEKTKENPWIVYEIDGKVVGYAYVSKYNPRESFKFTKEVSIYFNREYVGQKRGYKLFLELIKICKIQYNIHTLISVITVPNEKSISLHKKLGFKSVGELIQVGYKFNKYHNVCYLQLIL